MNAVDTDLTDPALYRNGFPHQIFTGLREAGAVHHHPAVEGRAGIPSIPFWSVVRHAEIQQLNRDWETYSALDGPGLAPMEELRGVTLVSMNPPDHTALRRRGGDGRRRPRAAR